MSGRFAIIADIHANLTALEAVLEAVGGVDGVWCLGDIVGYGPQPNECAARVAGFSGPTIRGNHDLGATGLTSLDRFNPYAKDACRWTSKALSGEALDFLTGLPNPSDAIKKTLLVHGSPRDPFWEYVLTLGQAEDVFASTDERFVFVGHSHIPFIFSFSDGRVKLEKLSEGKNVLSEGARYLINPGSVGQPRDKDPRSSFMILDRGDYSIDYRRVPYSISTVQAGIIDAGLPGFLAERLALGE
ncbi:MAG: metallophosphatase family protein [Chloroflexi bacterium]|nr:metallophosphatase family protein [Chloroflexota bacterium]